MKRIELSDEMCDSVCIHEDSVEKVRSQMGGGETISRVADLFKVLGDPTRARILCALSISELCVCDLSCILDMSQSAVSHQLRILKQARIVKNRRSGKVVYYTLDDDHVNNLFSTAFEHVQED